MSNSPERSDRYRMLARHGEEGEKELDAPELFKEVLRDALSVSAGFACLSRRCVRRRASSSTPSGALEALRVADLICQPEPAEMLVVLPNTKA